MNYHNKIFQPISNTENGAVTSAMRFHYHQEETILTCTYTGLNIQKGHLIGIVMENGQIDMRYHQVHTNGELMTGQCLSTPEILENGKIRLHEMWQWTSGDLSKGESILQEV